MRSTFAPFLLILLAVSAVAVEAPAGDGWFSVALLDLGATAKGSGQKFNKDWPANNALVAGSGRGGTMFGGPLIGGRVDITLLVPVDIKAIEVVGLDYSGTRQPKAIDILVDGQVVKRAELEEKPGKPTRIPVEAHGRVVAIVVTAEHPLRDLGNGKMGVAWGGWSRLRVYSTTDVAELIKPAAEYQIVASPAAIAPTSGAAVEGELVVHGEPRMSKGHPNTLWDAEDIAHYKKMLTTSAEMQAQFAGLKRAMDLRITKPHGVPQPVKGPDGAWTHLPEVKFGGIHDQISTDIANLGQMYVLTDDAKYAEFAKTLLLAYAEAYPNYAIGARPGFNHAPSKAFDQVLGDATWIIPVARGYDLIYNLPSITPEERKKIEDDLIKACARLIVSNRSMLISATNWSAIGTCAVLTAGFATDDDELVNIALYGNKGTKEKPTGGLFQKHFSAEAITDDGLWVEGAMGYQFMAMCALVMDAEILWHHGIDLYRHRDGAFKKLFDSPLRISYPDLTTPATHDSHHGSIVGEEAFLYEYAYRRYGDPRYLAILDQAGKYLETKFQRYVVSVLYDRDPKAAAPAVELDSVNFFNVGFGILRTADGAGVDSLLLKYGAAGSHAHPDKLALDLYANGEQVMIDPGAVWYEQPLYRQWYHTTLAHCTLTVDELEQKMCGAQHLVYGPGRSFGIQRAATDDAYPGVTMDRALFMTSDYVADLFGAFSRLPRKLDLAFHLRGTFASDLPFAKTTFPEPVENGYIALGDPRSARTDQAWTATITRPTAVSRFFAAGGTATEIIVGTGHYEMEHPAAIIERRVTAATIYGNAVDTSTVAGGHVRAISQAGSLEVGYGLLRVQTQTGTDLCFAAYRPGTYQVDGLETDAAQAFAVMDGAAMRALYLGGGTRLKIDGALIERSVSGLASIERTEAGGFLVANPSPTDATITVTVPAFAGLEAFALDVSGRRIGPAAATSAPAGSFAFPLKAAARVELSPKGRPSAYEFRQGMLKKQQEEREAVQAKARADSLARSQRREAEAKLAPVPAGTVVVVGAAAMTAQSAQQVRIADAKRGAIGKAISGWDATGQWLDWSFTVPADGYYHLTLCYCSALDKIERSIQVDGTEQEPFARMRFASTGGWANGSDDWQLQTAGDPVSGRPLLLKLKAGANVIRLTNTNDRGLNVNYLAITSPDVVPTRDLLAGNLPK